MRSKAAYVLTLVLLLSAGGRPVLCQTGEEDEMMKYQPPRDYGHDWRLGSMFALTPEDGVLVGTGAILYEFGFRVYPYVYRMELLGGITPLTGRFKFVYTLRMPALSKRLSLRLNAHASELEVRNFYGFGNNSKRDEVLDGNDYYRVASREYFVHPVLLLQVDRFLSLGLTASYRHFNVRHKDNRFLNTQNVDSLGNKRSTLGVGFMVNVDNRDFEPAPHRGIFFSITAWNYPNPFKNAPPFQRLSGEGRFYLGDTLLTDIMLAFRIGGVKILGPFPFYEAAFLGGTRSLRGYRLQRFAGDASAYGSAELRVSVGRLKLLIPTEVGLFLLADAGRVWLDTQSAGGWHADAGGGLWLAPISRDLILNISLALSPDDLVLYGGIGFQF